MRLIPVVVLMTMIVFVFVGMQVLMLVFAFHNTFSLLFPLLIRLQRYYVSIGRHEGKAALTAKPFPILSLIAQAAQKR